MRKLLSLLLILAIACCLFACGQGKQNPVEPANFYYCRKDVTYTGTNDVFASEVREIADNENIVGIMNNYLRGPESNRLYSPFPTSTQIISIDRVGTTLTVVFSPQLSRLSGPDLMLACVCTAMTLFNMTQAETVIITADGTLLDGRESVMLTPDRLVFTDNQPPETSETPE